MIQVHFDKEKARKLFGAPYRFLKHIWDRHNAKINLMVTLAVAAWITGLLMLKTEQSNVKADTRSVEIPIDTNTLPFIQAGRTEGAVAGYDMIGRPLGRTWWTYDEWGRRHLTDPKMINQLFQWQLWYQRRYIDSTVDLALEMEKKTGAPAEIMIAQAWIESMVGMSRLAKTATNEHGHKFVPSRHKGRKGVSGAVTATDDAPDELFVQYETRWWNWYWHGILIAQSYGVTSIDKIGQLCDCKEGRFAYATACKNNYVDYLLKLINDDKWKIREKVQLRREVLNNQIKNVNF